MDLEYLLTGVPSGPMRNFSKFHAMSVLLTGFQMRNWGLDIRLSVSSDGAGRALFKNLKIWCSFSPLASTCSQFIMESQHKATHTLSNKSPLNSKPLPGLTCFKILRISPPFEFSWWPNWVGGGGDEKMLYWVRNSSPGWWGRPEQQVYQSTKINNAW